MGRAAASCACARGIRSTQAERSRKRALGLRLARGLDEQSQRRPGVGDDAEIGHEDAADLGRLDVDVHELAALGVGVDAAGVAVRPAIADAEDEVARQQRRVAVAMAGLQPDHARHQRMVVGDRAPAHQRRDHRNAGQLGELDQQVAGVGVDDAAAGHDQRPLGARPASPAPCRSALGSPRLVERQRLVGLGVEFDLGHLHVERQVDQHRARAGPSA